MSDCVQNNLTVPDLPEGLKYHAFLCYNSDDDADVKKLHRTLEMKGFKIHLADRDFTAGVAVVDNINRAVAESRRVLLYITKVFRNSNWCLYEALMAVSNSVKHERQTVIPILIDITSEELPSTLKDINYIDRQAMTEEEFVQRICNALAAPDIKMSASMPAGNVAHGLAWSYYYGYLKLILPGFKGRVERSKFWDADVMKRRIVPKMFILLPNSCFCWPTLTDNDPMVEKAEPLEEFTANRSGNPGRSYRNFVYRVRTPNDGDYYCVCEYATPLMSLYEMEEEQLAGLDEDHKLIQKQKFHRVLEQILTHQKAEKCHSNFVLVPYDDKMPDGSKKYPISKLLAELVRKELDDEIRKTCLND